MGQTMCGTGYLSKAYEDEFSTLLDDCPSKPYNIVKEIIENEFQQPITNIYERFDPKPIAAGSIGQVHKAKLKSNSTEVVVKVQYPDVEKYFRMDCTTMKFLCKALSRMLKILISICTSTAFSVACNLQSK